MNPVSRRRFLRTSASTVAVAAGVGSKGIAPRAAAAPANQETAPPLFVSTWPFGKPANEAGLKALDAGGTPLDAIEKGINQCEAAGVESVGLSGWPNSEGIVTLDACIMTGPGHRAGSVACVQGFVHPISIARRVMETTKHVLLVGTGAERFAAKHGFQRGPKVTPARKKEWQDWKRAQAKADKSHDTIAMVMVAPNRDVYGGCSTSGLAYKLPGRVGDSPILGSGLYVDNEVGAAGSTGVGENVMRYCGTFMVVEYMRQGLHPEDACIEAIRRISRMDPKGLDIGISFVAVDRKGRYGAATTGKKFEYAVTCREFSKIALGSVVS